MNLQAPTENGEIPYSVLFHDADTLTLRDMVTSSSSFSELREATDNNYDTSGTLTEAKCAVCCRRIEVTTFNGSSNYLGVCSEESHSGVNFTFSDGILNKTLAKLVAEFGTLNHYDQVVIYYTVLVAVYAAEKGEYTALEAVEALALARQMRE